MYSYIVKHKYYSYLTWPHLTSPDNRNQLILLTSQFLLIKTILLFETKCTLPAVTLPVYNKLHLTSR